MLLTELKATNWIGSSLTLPLSDATNGFLIKEIEGLGPVKATLVSSTVANQDGSQYHAGRRENRNIVIKLGLLPDYISMSAHELRAQLYSFFMPKTEVTLDFTITPPSVVYQIKGRIESFEPLIFAKEPTVELSILCFDPAFIEPGEITVNAETISGGNTPTTVISYGGTIEAGILFELPLTRATSRIELFFDPPGVTPSYLMVLNGSYINGDLIRISTIVGNKFVTRTRDGVETSILYDLDPTAEWISFFPGNNLFSARVDGTPAIPYTVKYTKLHGGL